MNTNRDSGSICLLAGYPFDMYYELLAVYSNDFSDLLPFVMSTDDLNLIVLANCQ